MCEAFAIVFVSESKRNKAAMIIDTRKPRTKLNARKLQSDINEPRFTVFFYLLILSDYVVL